MGEDLAARPGMKPVQNLAANGPVGVLKPCCTTASGLTPPWATDHPRLSPCRRSHSTYPHQRPCSSLTEPDPKSRSGQRGIGDARDLLSGSLREVRAGSDYWSFTTRMQREDGAVAADHRRSRANKALPSVQSHSRMRLSATIVFICTGWIRCGGHLGRERYLPTWILCHL